MELPNRFAWQWPEATQAETLTADFAGLYHAVELSPVRQFDELTPGEVHGA